MSKYRNRRKLNRDVAPEEQIYGVIYEVAKKMPCCLARHPKHKCQGDVTGHHMKSVGSGGVDFMNVVPVCWALHQLVHGMDNMTQERVEVFFEIDFGEIAKDVTLRVIGGHKDDLDF